MLINVKMQTTVGILTFISMINVMFSEVDREKKLYNLSNEKLVRYSIFDIQMEKLVPYSIFKWRS